MKKANYIKYAVAAILGALMSLLVMDIRGLFTATEPYYIYMYLSDGFFVTAVLYIGFGLMLIAAHSGVLDIITYGFKSVIYLFTPIKKDMSTGGYYEYKLRQQEKRKAIPYYIPVIGLAFLIAAFVFMYLNSTVPVPK